MFTFHLSRSFLAMLLVSLAFAEDFSRGQACKGGTIYFSAHPVDSLLYQQPDLFHDFYVYKCLLSVVFTTGDRGIGGNSSQSLEVGLEAAYAYMAGASDKNIWEETIVQINDYNVTKRNLKGTPTIQILYLRLPDGASDGGGYRVTHSQSLKKLYQGNIRSITTADGESTYTLRSLMDLVASVIKQSEAQEIRVLDFKAPVPNDGELDSEHADHAISARLVMDAVNGEHIQVYLRGYAGNFMRHLDPTMNATHSDFFIKADTFFQYAEHDSHICHTHEECYNQFQERSPDGLSQDVKYVINWLEREYWVS
ncbi:hypothetical protein CC80DRAFT_541349 [Byssothecium circinans]|uniref:Uncharacterized protein n=1 Tax=Byssothecium circinans TaxID=147558 RepID=A0A6A5UES2_9PLEO|nr:hypothetical protein CC80DRAFT_541349 [Byssothecium circinans]